MQFGQLKRVAGLPKKLRRTRDLRIAESRYQPMAFLSPGQQLSLGLLGHQMAFYLVLLGFLLGCRLTAPGAA